MRRFSTLLLLATLCLAFSLLSGSLAQGPVTTGPKLTVYKSDILNFRLKQYFPVDFNSYDLKGVKASAKTDDGTSVGTYFGYQDAYSVVDRPTRG